MDKSKKKLVNNIFIAVFIVIILLTPIILAFCAYKYVKHINQSYRCAFKKFTKSRDIYFDKRMDFKQSIQQLNMTHKKKYDGLEVDILLLLKLIKGKLKPIILPKNAKQLNVMRSNLTFMKKITLDIRHTGYSDTNKESIINQEDNYDEDIKYAIANILLWFTDHEESNITKRQRSCCNGCLIISEKTKGVSINNHNHKELKWSINDIKMYVTNDDKKKVIDTFKEFIKASKNYFDAMETHAIAHKKRLNLANAIEEYTPNFIWEFTSNPFK